MNIEFIGIIFAVLIVCTMILYIGSRLISKIERRILIFSGIALFILYIIIIFLQITNLMLSNILVITLSIIAGYGVFKTFSKEALAQSIVIFAITASLVDFFSFGGGLTSEIIRSWEEESNVLLLFLCITIEVGPTIIPIVGIGDLFNITIFYCALDQLNYLEKRIANYIIPTLGLLLALIVGLYVGGIYAIPFMASTTILFVVINQRKIKKDELPINPIE